MQSNCCEARSMACSLSTFKLGASMGRLSLKNSPRTGSSRPLMPWRPSTLPMLKPLVLSHRSSVAPSPFCTFLVDLILIVLTSEQTLTRQTCRAPAVYCPKRVQMPRITITAACSWGKSCFSVCLNFLLSPMSIAHLDT